ncbi:hypothetical protein [Turicibacter sanguinis]|uniref:hypothetical protein n=1 Tax=Turicibacter sanguinis TaxID=154288 RepID=UPI00232FDE63|nr:hypothetical protein [Turicibacter sanguinis]MDB8577286.1 hypothetical protein [Turicibacter sanguinis]MDB8586614.1 hypothetical protein [Turicibacter sanguinis]
MDKFCKLDLQMLGEMKFVFEQVLKTGKIPVEQKDKARFYARYCEQLQMRIQKQMEMENKK